MTGVFDENNHIRAGRADEALLLTELALCSKGYWDYDPEFLRDCRAELTLTPEFVVSNPVFVVEEMGIAVGFYSLSRDANGDVELVHLYVEPDAIGRGYGKCLLLHSIKTAQQLGFSAMVINSDPNAEEFYKTMGAKRVGEVRSPVREGRMLPVLRLTLAQE